MKHDLKKGLTNSQIIWLIVASLTTALATTLGAQYLSKLDRTKAGGIVGTGEDSYEISKLNTEIRKIRSDNSGYLFALKVIALFVTVGGVVGGCLIGQSWSAQARISFEDKKYVDEVYQAVTQSLAINSSLLLRAAANMADLRGASLKNKNVTFNRSSFENAKLYLVSLTGSHVSNLPSCEVDLSPVGGPGRGSKHRYAFYRGHKRRAAPTSSQGAPPLTPSRSSSLNSTMCF
jgi:hypothetical protein